MFRFERYDENEKRVMYCTYRIPNGGCLGVGLHMKPIEKLGFALSPNKI